MDAPLGWQLGRGNYFADRDAQAGLLPVVGDELSLDGAYAPCRAENTAAEGAIWRRSSAHEPGDDGALPSGENQSARRLFASCCANTCFYCALLGFVGERRTASGAVYPLDSRLVTPGSWFVLPTLDGRDHDFSDLPESGTAGSGAGEDHEDHADRLQHHVFLFPGGLVLYWLVNNILSIAQQWQITRSMENAKPAHGK